MEQNYVTVTVCIITILEFEFERVKMNQYAKYRGRK